mgnify:CR=1 FL=1
MGDQTSSKYGYKAANDGIQNAINIPGKIN